MYDFVDLACLSACLQVCFSETKPASVHQMDHAALVEERCLQEQRNQKVLKVLQEKDKIIHEVQVEHGRLHSEVCCDAGIDSSSLLHLSFLQNNIVVFDLLQVQRLGKLLEEANQAKVTAQRATKAAESELYTARCELSSANEGMRKNFTQRESGFQAEIEALKEQVENARSRSAVHMGSADAEVKALQKQLHEAKIETLSMTEKVIRVEAENDALKKKLQTSELSALVCVPQASLVRDWVQPHSDAIVLQDFKSRLEEVTERSTTRLESIQAEHCSALEKLQQQISQLHEMQLCTAAVPECKDQHAGEAKQDLEDDLKQCLQDRIAVLEAANVALENALVHGVDHGSLAACPDRPVVDVGPQAIHDQACLVDMQSNLDDV